MGYSIACALLWGTTGIFVKLLSDLSVLHIMWGRFTFALILSTALWHLHFRRRQTTSTTEPSPGTWRLATLMTSYYLLATTAFSLAPVSLVGLIVATSPAFTFALEYLRTGRGKMTQLVGFGVTFAGLAGYLQVQSHSGHLEMSTATGIGSACAIGAALVRASFAVKVWSYAEQGRKTNLPQMNLQTMLLGSLLCSTALLTSLFALPSESQLTTNTPIVLIISYFVGLSALATILPTLLNVLGASRIDPVTHNIIGMSTPLIGGFLAWLILNEEQTLASIACGLATAGGIALSLRLSTKNVAKPTMTRETEPPSLTSEGKCGQ